MNDIAKVRSGHEPEAWLLLRGLGRETRHWFDFPSLLSERLNTRAVGVDLPGVGRASDVRVPLSVAAMARDVVRRMDADCRVPSFGILGISLGGMVALSLAEQFRSRVERLVIINSSTRSCSPARRLRLQAAAQLLGGALTRRAKARERIYYALTTNASAPQIEIWAARAALLAEERPANPRAVLRQLVAASGFSAPRIEQPSLILGARRDRLVSPACSEALARLLSAPCEQHPSAGHDLPLEAGEWVVERIAHWLRIARS